MSSTPPKKEGVEPGPQSPDDSEPHMDREAQDTQAQGLGYEFEVKEQDRWLPIANGGSCFFNSPSFRFARRLASHLHVDGLPNPAPESFPRRITVQRFPASQSTSLCAWKTVALQPAPCRPLPHSRLLRRHKLPPKALAKMLFQTLTFVTLLQLRES